MNRADLRWALDAALPHAKRAVTLESSPAGGQLYVWATDRYTAGVATLPYDGPALCCELSTSEARDLLKFIRPGLVAEQVEAVRMLVSGNELHVGIQQDSAVFDSSDSMPLSKVLLPLFRKLWSHDPEYSECIYRPVLFGRFAKAQRNSDDVLHLHPRRSYDHYGTAIVTIGEHFIGAIAGITYGQTGGTRPALLEVA